jgi:hypothetical protein
VQPKRRVGEVQYWGHGRWGRVFIAKDVVDVDTVRDPTHSRHADVGALRDRLAPDALLWFRTCETFGRAEGHAFASSWSRFLGCRVAGHTHVIGPFQSGLHSLRPGGEPTWSVDEGTVDGSEVGLMSRPGLPNTITCLHGSVPPGW